MLAASRSKVIISLLLGLVLLSLVIAGCSNQAATSPDPETYTASGHVVDSDRNGCSLNAAVGIGE